MKFMFGSAPSTKGRLRNTAVKLRLSVVLQSQLPEFSQSDEFIKGLKFRLWPETSVITIKVVPGTVPVLSHSKNDPQPL